MQLPIIVPVVRPQIDWGQLVDTITKMTGRSPTRDLDSIKRNVGDYYSFIAALGSFSEKLEPNLAVKFHDYLLKQLYFSFLITASDKDYLIMLKETRLSFLDNSNLILASGNLLDWKFACLTMCRESVSFELRYIFDFIYLHFTHLGLTEIFFNIKKNPLRDQTFTLEDQRK